MSNKEALPPRPSGGRGSVRRPLRHRLVHMLKNARHPKNAVRNAPDPCAHTHFASRSTSVMASDAVSSLYESWRNQIAEGSSSVAIENSFRAILELQDIEFVSFFVPVEATSLLKSAFTHERVPVRCVSIKQGGRCLIRLWTLLYEVDLEAVYQFDNLSESVRRKEDLMDFVLEVFSTFSEIVRSLFVASAPELSVELSSLNAYAHVLVDLLQLFHGAGEATATRIAKLCGSSAMTSFTSRERLRSRAGLLSHLVQVVVNIVFRDPNEMVQRARTFCTYQNRMVRLVSHFYLVCISAASGNAANVLTFPFNDSHLAFGSGSDSILSNSHSGAHPIRLDTVVCDWFEDVVLPLLASGHNYSDRVEALDDVMLLTRCPTMRRCRERVALGVAEYAVDLLMHYDGAKARGGVTSYDHLLVLALQALQDATIVLNGSQRTVVDDRFVTCCVNWLRCTRLLVDDATDATLSPKMDMCGRLAAEFWMFLHCEMARSDVLQCCQESDLVHLPGSKGQSGFQCSLTKLVLNGLVQGETGMHRPSRRTEVLVLALCQAQLGCLDECEQLLASVPALLSQWISWEDEPQPVDRLESKLRVRGAIASLKSNGATIGESSALLQRFQYLHGLPAADALLAALIRAHSASTNPLPGLSLSLIEEIIREDVLCVASIMVGITDDVAFGLQLFAPCFKWPAPNSARSLLCVARFVCDLLSVGQSDPAPSLSSRTSVGSFLQNSPMFRDEIKARVHLLCLIMLSLLDSCKKTCSVALLSAGSNTDTLPDMIKHAHVGELFAMIAVYALPYAYSFNPDLAVLLPRLHFLCAYAMLHLHNGIDRQSAMERLEARASAGFLGGLTDVDDNLVLGPASGYLYSTRQLHALELLDVLSRTFGAHVEVLKVMLPFVLDLQQNLLFSEADAFLSHLEVPHFPWDDTSSPSASPPAPAASSSWRSRVLNLSPSVKEQLLCFIRRFKSDMRRLYDTPGVSMEDGTEDAEEVLSCCLRSRGLWPMHEQVISLPEVILLKSHLMALSAAPIGVEEASEREERVIDSHWPLVGEVDNAYAPLTCRPSEVMRRSAWRHCARQTHRLRSYELSPEASAACGPLSPSGITGEVSSSMYDIVSSRFLSSTHAAGHGDRPPERTLPPPKAIAFTQLSGGNDALAVFGAWTWVDHACSLALVRLRIHNSSAFKIPFFSVHIALGAASAAGPGSDSVLFPPEAWDPDQGRVASLELCDPATGVGSNELLGGEYFPPGAVWEREYRVRVHAFACIHAVVRIHFPECVREPTAIIGSSPTTATRDGRPAARYASTTHHSRSTPPYGSHFGSTVSAVAAQSKWTAVVSCVPLVLPPGALLVPYGRGRFCSLGSGAGVPWDVASALFLRLGSRYSHILRVAGFTAAAPPQQWLSRIAAQSLAANGFDPFFNTADCMAVCSDAAGVATSVMWCLQTLWGSNIVLFLEVGAQGHMPGDVFEATVQIRCSDGAALTAVLLLAEELVAAVGGGILAIM